MKNKNSVFAVGDAKNNQRTKSRVFSSFSMLDSDSDSESPAAPAAPNAPTKAAKPVKAEVTIADMLVSNIPWGDLLADEEDFIPIDLAVVEVVRVWGPTAEADAEASLWAQPWAYNLELYCADNYDLRFLTDTEYQAMMTWLYQQGWAIEAEDRNGVEAYPDNQPPRVWIQPVAQRFNCLHGPSDSHGHSHSHAAPKPVVPLSAPGSDEGRRRAAPRPIFCDGGEKCKEGCPYVHGDTIPVTNPADINPATRQPYGLCQFGDSCGKRRAAVGRTPCSRLHPDEGAWNASMVRNRPV
jgi:hypothetical protein